MAYDLEYQVDGDILCVYATGDRDTDSPGAAAQDAWTRIAQQCGETGLSRVLIISHVTGRYPTLDTYETMSTLDRYGISRHWKIAYVNADPTCREDLMFMMAVADNKGFSVRLFDDEARARKWLAR